MNRSSRCGLVLIEVLIVIAILGLLFQLLLPAIQSARESARQTHCQNNLHQLALACIAHVNTHGHFPTGGWNSAWVGDPDRGFGRKQPGGWGYNILPYIEQQDLHDLGKGLPDPQRQKMVAQVYGTVVPLFTCSSRRLAKPFRFIKPRITKNADMAELLTINKTARSDYAANMGSTLPPVDFAIGGPNSYKEADEWKNGTDPKSSWIASENNGVIYQRSAVTPAMVTDGLSKTFVLGEKMVPAYSKAAKSGASYCDDQSYTIGFSFDNNRACSAETPPSRDSMFPRNDVVNPRTPWSEEPKTLWRFGSNHPTVFHMANCDGSVHRIVFSVDSKVFSGMGTRDQSESLQLNE